ncbi:serine protease [Bradyrhizobium oligotrophicum]|uniref:serine protease n=1 Tax=Bradyrhizobium oligotrophicum TaxID=44255 RepID=UPI003EBA9676
MAKKTVTKATLKNLYGARKYLSGKTQEELGLKIAFDVYFQDPAFAKKRPGLPEFDEALITWEPSINDGPTSARFAVVDYDGDTGDLTPPAEWQEDAKQFVDAKKVKIDISTQGDSLQAHQVHVWAVLQRALDFFEGGFGLGRRISWGFDGNRLIVVPHAGNGRNAFYDRQSKSLQLYYFDDGPERIYTCLSSDIVNHEFAHAVLDGVRPHFVEAIVPETAAFHEFVGDLTAILIAFRNNDFRNYLVEESKGDLGTDNDLNRLAEQFGKAAYGRDYLRTARNCKTLSKLKGEQRPHLLSEVLTGAMFDIIIALSKYYIDKRGRTISEAFWDTIQRMQQMAIQPLDLLPPVDVTFNDYAKAVLRMEEIANPSDPDDYRGLMIKAFRARDILDDADVEELTKPRQVFNRPVLDVFHEVDDFSSSRSEAYRFLDDNRDRLFIPPNVDVIVSDLYVSHKLSRQGRRLPKQIILQYIWREDVELKGSRFGRFEGQSASLLCGGTLAFDHEGNLLAWARKPGTTFSGSGQRCGDDERERQLGEVRRETFLNSVAARVKSGSIGTAIGGPKGLLASKIPPFTSREVDGALRFELSPHFGIHDDSNDELGERRWQTSS